MKFGRGIGVTTCLTAAALAGCGEPGPQQVRPSIGEVIAKDSYTRDGLCLLSNAGVCLVYRQIPVHEVTVGACRSESGTTALVDRSYLERRERLPSDNPLIIEGSVTVEDAQVSCMATFEVDESTYNGIRVGQIITATELK